MKILTINNLSYSYDNKKVLDDISISINKASFTSIIGPNGSGKSTIIKAVLGLIDTNGEIKVDDLVVNKENIKKVRTKIGVVFENPDNQFVAETVMDDIAFSLENLNFSRNEIRKRIKEVASYLKIEKILEREPHTLSGGQKQMVSLASALVTKPDILIMDEALTMMDLKEREDTLLLLKKLCVAKDLTILNITHDSEELVYSDDIIVIDKGKIVLEGTSDEVFEKDIILKRIGIKLPFVVDLSIKLKYYGVVDRIIYDKKELINKIWK